MSHGDDVIPDSTYPALEPPGEFKSQVPAHLLGGLTDTDKYMLDQMSIMRQYSDWCVLALLSQDKNIRLTNGKLRRATDEIDDLKEERKTIKVGWKVISAIVGGIGGLVGLGLAIYSALHGGGGQ